MPERAFRKLVGRRVPPILLALAFLAPGCSPSGGTPTADKPRVNSRQLKHIEELQKKGASTAPAPRTSR